METARIAQILDEMGTILEIQGENPFRCRAYHNAAQALREPAGGPLGDDRRRQPGGGAGDRRDDAIEDRPACDDRPLAGLREAPRGDAAGARRPPAGARAGSQEDQGPLRDAEGREPGRPPRGGEAGQIAKLKGFGAKTEANILEGIAFLEKTGGRILQNEALFLVAPIFEAVRQHPQVIRAEVCGSLRRRAETIGDLDILFSAKDPGPVLDDFVALPEVAKVLAHGPTKASVLLPGSSWPVRAVRPAGGRGSPVPVRAPLLHRLEGAQHRDAQAGPGSRLQPQRVRPGRRQGRGPAAGPRPTCSRPWAWRTSLPSCARTPARSRPRRRGSCPTW